MSETKKESGPSMGQKENYELTDERKALLLAELNTIATLMGATWNEPKYAGTATEKASLQRSIPVNILSRAMIYRLHQRANAIMEELGWFNDSFVKTGEKENEQ